MQWDLTFHSHRMERRFMERFNKGLLLADKAHCVLLLLLMLFGIAHDLTSDSHHGAAPWIQASGADPRHPVFAWHLCCFQVASASPSVSV